MLAGRASRRDTAATRCSRLAKRTNRPTRSAAIDCGAHPDGQIVTDQRAPVKPWSASHSGSQPLRRFALERRTPPQPTDSQVSFTPVRTRPGTLPRPGQRLASPTTVLILEGATDSVDAAA